MARTSKPTEREYPFLNSALLRKTLHSLLKEGQEPVRGFLNAYSQRKATFKERSSSMTLSRAIADALNFYGSKDEVRDWDLREGAAFEEIRITDRELSQTVRKGIEGLGTRMFLRRVNKENPIHSKDDAQEKMLTAVKAALELYAAKALEEPATDPW